MPYKGLVPYTEDDAAFFFGRDNDREIITANLRSSRLTVLYGPSGVGKSSVLHAGVAYYLHQLARWSLTESSVPEFALVTFSSWRDDPVAGLVNQVRASVEQLLSDARLVRAGAPTDGRQLAETARLLDSPDAPRGLHEALSFWSERLDGELLIILDQFEEYFLYHAEDTEPGTFDVEFPRAVMDLSLPVSFLISMREDGLAKLDRFKQRIPILFDNYLRINHLSRQAARDAIIQPIEQYNQLYVPEGETIGVEPALVEAILDQVKVGEDFLSSVGGGRVDGRSAPGVETPYLQLVLTRLWNEEQAAGSRELRLATLDRLGGARSIVRTHLDGVMATLSMAEQDIAASAFRYLVTPSGSKIAYSSGDLADYANVAADELEPVLLKLSGGDFRILRAVPPPHGEPSVLRYEIFHDALAAPILDWRARYLRRQVEAEAEKRVAEVRQAAEEQVATVQAEAEQRVQQARMDTARQVLGIFIRVFMALVLDVVLLIVVFLLPPLGFLFTLPLFFFSVGTWFLIRRRRPRLTRKQELKFAFLSGLDRLVGGIVGGIIAGSAGSMSSDLQSIVIGLAFVAFFVVSFGLGLRRYWGIRSLDAPG